MRVIQKNRGLFRFSGTKLQISKGQSWLINQFIIPKITNMVPHNFPMDYGRLLTDSERLLPENTAIKTLKPVGVSNSRNEIAYGVIYHLLPDENLGSLLTLLINLEEKATRVLCVADSGVGISESEIPYIFDRFYRGSASQKTGAQGTGLGLAISKELVSRMGGEITLESGTDQGSTFTIWLRPVVSAML
jgi:hypothetical protein